MIMVHSSLCQAKDIRFNEDQRRSALDSLSKTDREFVGPCTIGVSKLGQRGTGPREELPSLSAICCCQLEGWQSKAYDQQEMEDCLRSAMEKALQAEFPQQKGTRPQRATEIWDHRKALRNIPEALLAFADLHRQLKQRIVWRTWAALARQSAEARTAKQRKFAQRQALIDEQLGQAEAKSARDGSHSLYKELFGKGEDFQLVTSSEVVAHLRSIKLGPIAQQHVALLLKRGGTNLAIGLSIRLRAGARNGGGTVSVMRAEAFDMVDRRRLREALELAAADPFFIDLVGKLHVEAFYEMTASDQTFSVATKRGIKQGCKLAPSLFAFATFLLNREVGEHCDIEALKQILTMYADDTLLQMHFEDLPQLQEALRLCDLLLDQLTELGFKVNPEKSALLLQLHGGSAQQIRNKLILTKKGEKYVQLPSGRLIALKTQVPYLGIIISYHDYEMQSLRHRLQASKAAMKDSRNKASRR
ncbi:dnaJ [Symbiodinium necroappetens]|uniref:DnaJ protein n=1 Tax=Symbiodinium necroappetens TaxID=1628268 RepID=A0A812ZDW8_9DINO|nr:dnaJ [Symbiodinium necroappetens]